MSFSITTTSNNIDPVKPIYNASRLQNKLILNQQPEDEDVLQWSNQYQLWIPTNISSGTTTATINVSYVHSNETNLGGNLRLIFDRINDNFVLLTGIPTNESLAIFPIGIGNSDFLGIDQSIPIEFTPTYDVSSTVLMVLNTTFSIEVVNIFKDRTFNFTKTNIFNTFSGPSRLIKPFTITYHSTNDN